MAAERKATPETILVVDDEAEVRRASQKTLRAAGFDVLTAGSGREALDTCEEHAGVISLALIDVVMPGMTGPELAERLEVRYPDVKILFMSGYTRDEIGDLGVMDPRAHFLGKPFSADMLRRKVRDVLDGA